MRGWSCALNSTQDVVRKLTPCVACTHTTRRMGGRSCHFGAFNNWAQSKYYGSMLDVCNSIDSSGCNGASTWHRCLAYRGRSQTKEKRGG